MIDFTKKCFVIVERGMQELKLLIKYYLTHSFKTARENCTVVIKEERHKMSIASGHGLSKIDRSVVMNLKAISYFLLFIQLSL